MHMKNPPIGIRILSESIVRNSKMLSPIILTLSKIPKDREARIPIELKIIPGIIHAFFLDHFLLSIKYEAITSINDIEDVIAAKNTSAKNIIPHTRPSFILLNTNGIVWNIKPDPPAGSSPNANTAGKIAKQAKTAIIRSKSGI